MNPVVALPFIVQGLAIGYDEFYFHRRRGLTRWERWGHPLDTLTVLLCIGYLLWNLPSRAALFSFAGLALFSCLFVTKDEFVHQKVCSAGEQWLHALLFILHPICLALAAWLWWHFQNSLVLLEAFILALFFVYQLTYWNLFPRRWSYENQ